MDKAELTMIENLQKNTGKSLQEWITLVQAKNFAKHGDILRFLKEEHNFTHGFANLVAHKAKGSDAGSVSDTNVLIDQQYSGKEHLRPLYDKLVAAIQALGSDVELAPKNAYVSVRRKKQFAMLTPATKTRFELGLNLKGQTAEGMLEAINSANAMCSHKINLSAESEISSEITGWIKAAYNQAG